MQKQALFATIFCSALSACGGVGDDLVVPTTPSTPLPEGKPVNTPGFETYTTNHSGEARVRRDLSRASDAAVLSAFDTGATGPTGYRRLLDSFGPSYAGRVSVDVLAEVSAGEGGKATRLLRLTTDQAPFRNEEGNRLITESGKYYFKGASYAWVTIDNQPMLSGHHAQGLESLVLDFDTQTASIDLRTQQAAGSDVRIELKAANLPFNIRSGAFGGPAEITVWSPDLGQLTALSGTVRGGAGGTPTYSNNLHGLTTTGLYSASGTASPEAGGAAMPVSVEGLWVGQDPNAIR